MRPALLRRAAEAGILAGMAVVLGMLPAGAAGLSHYYVNTSLPTSQFHPRPVPPADPQPGFVALDFNAGSRAGYIVPAPDLAPSIQAQAAALVKGVVYKAGLLPPGFGPFLWQAVGSQPESGQINASFARSVNAAGQVVGDGTLSGIARDRGPLARIAWRSHAFLFDAASGVSTDLTPTALNAQANRINDAGFITGWMVDKGSFDQQAFLRDPAGNLTILTPTKGIDTPDPSLVNAAGTIAGTFAYYPKSGEATRPQSHAFAAPLGKAMADLGLPRNPAADSAGVAAIDGKDNIVGADWLAAAPQEHFAVYWQRTARGWIAHNLGELITTPGYIAENAIDIDAAGNILVLGRPAGTTAYNSLIFVLSPAT